MKITNSTILTLSTIVLLMSSSLGEDFMKYKLPTKPEKKSTIGGMKKTKF